MLRVMQVFYSLLIPPIVFYAGFSLKKKLFFKNLVTIAIFGILGCNLTGVCPALPQSAHTTTWTTHELLHYEYIKPPTSSCPRTPGNTICFSSQAITCDDDTGTTDCWQLHAAYLLSMGIYPILERSQIYSLPVGPNSTTEAVASTSLLPTPWETSLATLATNPTGSAHMHAAVTAQQHQESQLLPRSDRAHMTPHRRSLASSPLDASESFPWVATDHLQVSEDDYSQAGKMSELDLRHSSIPQAPAHSSSGPGTAMHDEVLIEEEARHKKLLSAAMRLGTVFSPTDNLAILHYLSPNTQPVLHSLLFGEGVMNDITAVIMLRTTAQATEVTWSAVGWSYWHFLTLFSASSVMGVSAGLLSALLTKRTLLCTPPVTASPPCCAPTRALLARLMCSVTLSVMPPVRFAATAQSLLLPSACCTPQTLVLGYYSTLY